MVIHGHQRGDKMKFCYNVIEEADGKHLLYQLEYDIDCPYLTGTTCNNSKISCIYADKIEVVKLPSYNYKICYKYIQNTLYNLYNETKDIKYLDALALNIRCEKSWNEHEHKRRNIINISDMQKFLDSNPDIRLMTPIKNTYRPKYLYINKTPVKDFSTNTQYKKIKCLHCGKEVYSNTNYCFACLQYENFESK